jgi:hypothetical protein
MTDEPENITLKLLREIRTEQAAMREDMKEARVEQRALASLLGKASDAVTAIAATQERHSEILGKLAWRTRSAAQCDRRQACLDREAHGDD